MDRKKKMLSAIVILTVIALASTTVFAIWSMSQPVPMGITILGSNSFVAYTDAAHTQLYTGDPITYGDAVHSNTTVQNPPFALYCVNTGEEALTVTWSATGVPTGITMQTMTAPDGVTWNPLAMNAPITVQPGAQIDFGFNLQLNNPALGTYSWATVINAHQP